MPQRLRRGGIFEQRKVVEHILVVSLRREVDGLSELRTPRDDPLHLRRAIRMKKPPHTCRARLAVGGGHLLVPHGVADDDIAVRRRTVAQFGVPAGVDARRIFQRGARLYDDRVAGEELRRDAGSAADRDLACADQYVSQPTGRVDAQLVGCEHDPPAQRAAADLGRAAAADEGAGSLLAEPRIAVRGTSSPR